MICTPDSLMAEAKCYRCIPAGALPSVMTYLMCQWSNKPTAPTILFSWEPQASSATWVDGNGVHMGNYAVFVATADINTLTQIGGWAVNTLTALNNLSSLPVLNNLTVGNQVLTALDISNCTSLSALSAPQNFLSVFWINTILFQLDAMGVLGGFVDVASQTPAAPPDAGPPDGATAAANLAGKGWFVNTD